MLREAVLFSIPLMALTLASCAGPRREKDVLDPVADDYVRLVLDVGRHDKNYVDAYHGPAEWKAESDSADPVPRETLGWRASALLERVRSAPSSPRRDFLEKQLVAVEGFVRRLSGQRMTLAEEARTLYDATPMDPRPETIDAAIRALEGRVPGTGPLADRIDALRLRCRVPADRVRAVAERALAICRRATLDRKALPPEESFRIDLVRDKPWGAYNWYEGGYHSRIEINTDLPTDVTRLLGTMAHEGYPGHHTQNVLLEQRLVRGRGWREWTIYPLYSPQSLLAEGVANAGLDLVLSRDERRRVLRDELAPAAGLSAGDVLAWDEVQEAMRPLRYARGIAARMLLDEGRPEDEVVVYLVRESLMNEDQARKALEFARAYRAYVYNYTLGEDLVRAWIGDGPDRTDRFFRLLESPATPSSLRRKEKS